MTQTKERRRSSFGPLQLADYLGVPHWWWLGRARRLGLVDGPDREDGRWSADAAERIREGLEELRAKVGALPDMGAGRAVEVLGERLGIEVSGDAVRELVRTGQLPVVGAYKERPLYCGRALEALAGREDAAAVLAQAERDGRLMVADEAAAYLRIRRSDFGHLVRAGVVAPADWGNSRYYGQLVPLYRALDLDTVAEHAGVDLDAVRATPAGRRSPLATLPTANREA
ncbi:hypothetical protein [Actinomadura montaniterrae]|uniref:Uncharacterized protein n=1 Tax=Actinomadura montaniterrae TaxID=1803903 RepID=A0A6L3VPE7_9ACTN|nr:hypothetical protein [Actinomadura montaniterrae]KAB2376993.1 hypothetical protein F9B16_24475 [Actinomadura montaniterrae]